MRTRAFIWSWDDSCQWGSARIPNTGDKPAWLLCRTYATMPYIRHNAVCRMKYAVREHASSHWLVLCWLDIYLAFLLQCTLNILPSTDTETLPNISVLSKTLTGGNWQKWKRVFLTCPCHEIYRDEAVGLKSCKNTWKITIFVKMWNLGQYRENLIFCQ